MRSRPDPSRMARHIEPAAQLLRALANPHRLMILYLLSEGELSVSELNALVPLSQSALSQHLSVLRRDGLVDTRRESQSIHYRIANGLVLKIIKLLHQQLSLRAASQHAGETS
ncbi:ArsR/SmtB family transcription factor [Marinobacterium sedimentorum]|uniref:ArsR/SmtB family transcription factor n=1 Tax=Marinobacterium sedimentorum TaxID=2927804 RepID=UPI0020C6399F|nr:metalloregulator ArsR/SmtB family transcription factor [Marinobacterium sedimentorum]MCP8687344.1 metalloregulator ArsR/SmtB family transcription factor [Marinobacterium sedimentorum]